MTEFVISDLHFNHQRILEFTNHDGSKVRNFANVDEMNEHIIRRWNETVSDTDRVYMLGDLYFGNIHSAYSLTRRLNGKIVLLYGNHDHIKRWHPEFMNLFEDVAFWKKFKDRGIILSHMPLHPSTLGENGGAPMINIHGHIHGNVSPTDKIHMYINASCENLNYIPRTFDELIRGDF